MSEPQLWENSEHPHNEAHAAVYTGRSMRLLRFGFAFLAVCLAPLWAGRAQTYTPRQIRFEGGGDPAELLRLSGLQPGKPLTKAQIEAALGKLADTGAFTDLSYSVTADALVIKLGGAAVSGGQALPVRYINLPWWPPEELTKLLEARVPLFHGELPLTGSLTDQVCAALVQLLAEKDVPNAKVEATPSTLPSTAASTPGAGRATIAAIGLNLTQPTIVLGKLELSGAAPATQAQLGAVINTLSMQEFQTDVTAQEIRENAADTERNAGFLDATVDPPVFSAPRKDMNGFAVDATAAVHPGELYRITAVDLGTRPPLSQTDAEKATDLKPGQPAGALTISTAAGKLQHAYVSHGHLAAKVNAQTSIDRAAHTAMVRFSTEPGELFHLASVDTTALPAEFQSAFAREFRGKPGMEAGLSLDTEVVRTLRAIHAPPAVRITLRADLREHTAFVVLSPPNAPHVIEPPPP